MTAVFGPDEPLVTSGTATAPPMANPAFASLCGIADASTIEGRLLGDWLVGTGADGVCAILVEHAGFWLVQQVAASVRSDAGAVVAVRASAAMLTDGDVSIGFTLRRAEPTRPRSAWVVRALLDARVLLAQVGSPAGCCSRRSWSPKHFVHRALSCRRRPDGRRALLRIVARCSIASSRSAVERRVRRRRPGA
jgi:hypothetical protein